MKPEREVEFKRISEDIRCLNSILKPLTALDENTFDDFHAKVYNLDSGKARFLHPNMRRADNAALKKALTGKPGRDPGEEMNGLSSLKIADEEVKPSRKSCTMASSHSKTFYGKKENMESGSAWTRATLSSSKPKVRGDSPDSADLKRLQEEIKVMNKALKPLTRLENEVFEEICNAVYGPELLAIDTQQLSNPIEHKAIDWKNSDVPSQAVVEKSLHDSSQKRRSCATFVETACGVQEGCIQISSSMPTDPVVHLVEEKVEEISCDLWTQSPEMVKTPLLSQFKTRSEEETQRPELVKTSLLSQLETRSTEREAAQKCEEIGTQNHDHVVVIFSVQKNPEGRTARVCRQKSSKLYSICTRYSTKFLSWMTSLCREHDIKGCLRRMIPRSPRAFVKLNSQNLPEFSAKMSPLSAEKNLAEEDELKAVLVKINEVFRSMERTFPENVQVNQTNNRLNGDGG